MLVELGFISNTRDNELFDKNFDAYAEAIAKGICMALGVVCKTGSAETQANVLYRVQVGAFGVKSNAEAIPLQDSARDGLGGFPGGRGDCQGRIDRSKAPFPPFLAGTGPFALYGLFQHLQYSVHQYINVHRLKLPALLRQILCTTNPMESANSVCMGIVRRIKNWKNGEMILRNIAAGFLEAEKSFRRIKGYRQIPILISSLFSFLKLDTTQNTSQSA